MISGHFRVFITDGLVRDVVGLEAVGLPVYCAGIIANSPARNGPGTVGFPVVLGGVTISPGDILVGDRDGVAVVPRLAAETVLARLAAVRAAEQALDAQVRQGLEMPDFAEAVLKSDRSRFVD
ncbi:RraA family protein [Mesorhizobium kowhaii]|uniref:RraA family protein n=1 Tax=Mesorhizobium kowhaii TaxID=1300272 RepID=UPI00142E2749|nr:RraA family protein [Mesorhizobium kowhaii]